MLNISAQSDYAISLVEHLRKKEGYTPLSKLNKNLDLPQRYMARIAASLVKNKILESREGKIGGYKLSANAKKVSLYDFLKIFEGDLTVVKCQKDGYECALKGVCRHGQFLRGTLSRVLEKDLKRYKLLELFSN